MKRVIIYGMSHAGFRIASFLKETGAEVIAAVPQGSGFIHQLERLQVRVEAGDLEDFGLLPTLGIGLAQSIILPSDDDLFNLNAALRAVEINRDIRVVLRLFNLSLGKKLEKSVRNFTVLSVSQLASSSFATAALIEKPLLSFEIGEEILNIYEVNSRALQGKSIAAIEQEQEIKVLAVNDDVFPAAGRVVNPGERVIVFSRFATAASLCGVIACPNEGGRRSKGGPKKDLLGSIKRLDKILFRTIVAVAAVAGLCVLFFHATEHLSYLDSVYLVVTAMTSGFGDVKITLSSAVSKFIGMGLMISGMAGMAMLFAIISDNLLRKRLELLLGRRRIHIRDHVILCGVGDVGIRILEDLVRIRESSGGC